jgi:bifunctional UDP-N-acetylglucosamine pyrophosphorylase/glucosamine-1-phosphate N-acetyltransferase
VTAHSPAAVLVLAAGEGTRMRSATPKVLHVLAGRSLVGHVIGAARELGPKDLVVVVGHGRGAVTAHLADLDPSIRTAVQEPQNGTGHAARIALEQLSVAEGTVVVVYGDTPLLTGATLQHLASTHAAEGNAATVLTAVLADPHGYGRVRRDADGSVAAIVEQRDADEGQLAITEINSGMYAFDAALLRSALGRLTTDNAQGEEYLTDVLAILRADGHRVGAVVAADPEEVLGVNDRVQLAHARRVLRDRILDTWMRAGVTVVDPATTWVDVDVTLEPDAVLHQDTRLHGRTHVAAGAQVGPGCTLRDTSVGEGAVVRHAWCEEAEIGPRATVGPFTYLRPGTRLGEGSKAGAYVEIKNAQVGAGAKVPHLSYVGDAEIGEGSNIGAATVFVNYDGVAKHRTVVGDHVRIGSDTMLVAPVTIGDGAYTAAGSVITDDVPPGAMAVGRARQRTILGWVARKRAGTASARAAEAASGTPTDQTQSGAGTSGAGGGSEEQHS